MSDELTRITRESRFDERVQSDSEQPHIATGAFVKAMVACDAVQLFVQQIERTQLPALVQIQCQRAGCDETQGQRQNLKHWHAVAVPSDPEVRA